jgi:hypothetical protein
VRERPEGAVTSRAAAVAVAGVVLLAVALAFGLTRGQRPETGGPSPRAVAPTADPSPTAAAGAETDPGRLRDIFHFRDEMAAAAPPVGRLRAAAPATPAPAATATPAPGPRLVGLLRRSGTVVAALSLDGAVELAAPGESAAGVMVLAIADDSVRVRRSDGSEETLSLPD